MTQQYHSFIFKFVKIQNKFHDKFQGNFSLFHPDNGNQISLFAFQFLTQTKKEKNNDRHENKDIRAWSLFL